MGISFDQAWFDEKFGELPELAKELILAAMPQVLVAHREGLVELEFDTV